MEIKFLISFLLILEWNVSWTYWDSSSYLTATHDYYKKENNFKGKAIFYFRILKELFNKTRKVNRVNLDVMLTWSDCHIRYNEAWRGKSHTLVSKTLKIYNTRRLTLQTCSVFTSPRYSRTLCVCVCETMLWLWRLIENVCSAFRWQPQCMLGLIELSRRPPNLSAAGVMTSSGPS